MLELTAEIMMPEVSDRFDPWGDIEYRKGILRRLSDAIVEQVMDKITVRRIRDSATRQVRVEARLLVWERESAMGNSRPITIKDESMGPKDIAKEIERLEERMKTEAPDPVAFLKGRLEVNQAREEAAFRAKARLENDSAIKRSIRTPGEALPVVSVKIRKIQMPEEVK